MSDRCSCVDGPNYRCGAGRPCDVHGNVDELMEWGEYVDRRGRTWRGLWNPDYMAERWLDAPAGQALTRAQMRLRIVREKHREVCPGLLYCSNHPVPTVTVPHKLGCYYIYAAGQECGHEHDLEWAINRAQQLAKESSD